MRRPLYVLVFLMSASMASATGLYNLPTSLRQCFGVGFGPGYHAPLVLGNPLKAKTATQPIRWSGPHPPPSQGCFAEPSAFVESASAPCVSSDHAKGHYVVGHEVMAPQPAPMPTYAAPQATVISTTPHFAAPTNNPYAGYETVPAPGTTSVVGSAGR